ncbi:MAG TPA: choice-of-anchor tandem repeat GloVer-containing protein [Terracidiphilus sp.]|nr:choice-of-anchor tandem repeat GloVer-containing protein [Terracidiphilus sp.]
MSRLTCSLLFVLVSSAAGSTAASAQTLTTLTSLTDGQLPWGSLVVDANGNLFGTTEGGGASGYGTVYEIAKTSSGYASTPTTLVSFTGNDDGSDPLAALIVDANGNLFGTAQSGGVNGVGTVFEIVKTSSGYASTPTIVVSFDNSHGAVPEAGLIADANGNLFGTTAVGGLDGGGTVFEIVKTSSGYASAPTILVSFDNAIGAVPEAGLIADANGNLFGTTAVGGGSRYGTVFEIAKTSSGYASTPTTLVNFDNVNGAFPEAGLIADTNGNLFGTTNMGGANGVGTVFEIANSGGVYASTPITLVDFNGSNGSYPTAGLIADANGNLFGTTSQGGAGYGTVFEIAKTSSGYASTPTTLVSFIGSDGSSPDGGLIVDGNGDLFGTTTGGGSAGTGTAFEITGSGFVPPKDPKQFAGTPGSANCIGKSISSLADTDGGITHAAPALGYASVSALQSAIANYCGK